MQIYSYPLFESLNYSVLKPIHNLVLNTSISLQEKNGFIFAHYLTIQPYLNQSFSASSGSSKFK